MSIFSKVIIVLLTMSLLACKGIRLDVAEDQSFDPKQNSSYAWAIAPLKKGPTKEAGLMLLDTNLRSELDSQLAEKGYTLVDPSKADFLVSYSFYTQEEITDRAKDKIIAQNKGWITSIKFDDGSTPDFESLTTERANLHVYFENPQGEVIWDVVASKAVENKFPSRSEFRAVIKRAVTRMMFNLPEKQ